MGVRAWGWGGRAYASRAGGTAKCCRDCLRTQHPPASAEAHAGVQAELPAFPGRSMGAAGPGPSVRGQSATGSAPRFALLYVHKGAMSQWFNRRWTLAADMEMEWINPVGLGDLQDSFICLSVVSVAFLGRTHHCHVGDAPGRMLQDFHR